MNYSNTSQPEIKSEKLLNSVFSEIVRANERLNAYSSDITSKLHQIKDLRQKGEDPSNTQPPQNDDFNTRISIQISMLNQLCDRIERINNHLSEII